MVTNRIGKYLENKGISFYSFENTLGVSRGSISKAVKENKNIGSSVLENILSKFPDLSPDWLLTGKGPMLRQSEPARGVSYTHGGEDLNTAVFEDTPQYSVSRVYEPGGVPVYDLPVSAGALGVVDCGSQTPIDYSRLPVFEGCKAIFPVVGISMEPEIHSGDIVGVSEIEPPFRWEYLNTSRVYLIITRQDRMIKYISDASSPDYIVCASTNAAPFRVDKADILQIYQVRAWAHRQQ